MRRPRAGGERISLPKHAGRSVMNQVFLVSLAGALGCEGGFLAISAGAPVSGVIFGIITDCGSVVVGGVVVLRVQQNEPYQTRPVDVEVGPVTTDRDGRYVVEVGPSFAVPGRAQVQLVSVNGTIMDLVGPDLHFAMGVPPKDTLRLDADVGAHRGSCSSR
jgi:hypothetical protein